MRINNDNRDEAKETMIKCLEKSLGVVSTAAKKAGVCRRTHYRWIKEDPEYAEAVRETNELSVDFAETALFELISMHNASAIIFFLKCRAKHRGYIEREEQKQDSNITVKWE